MAKIKAAVSKTPRVTVSDDDDDESIPVAGAEAEEGDTNEETTSAQQDEAKPTVSVKTSDDDIVTFVPFEEVDPAPVVGHYKFRDNGVMKLTKGESYQIPLHVAIHLVDRKKGTIVNR